MRKIIIYGIGKIGKSYVEQCMAQGVKDIELVDSNSSLWGTNFLGQRIWNPDEILWRECTLVVVSAGDSFSKEIVERLTKRYGVPEEKIVSYLDSVILRKGEIYNWGGMSLIQRPSHSEKR